jgi:protein-S-isoprenylcysteine O-methyltransferase Ste14
MESRRLLPPTYLMLGLAAMALAQLLVSGPRVIFGPWRLIGVPLIISGVWLAVHSDALFKRLETEIKPLRPSRIVVSEGPYRFSRHPMYVGFLAVLAGAAVLAGTLLPILVLVGMVWLFTAFFVVPEERHMEEQFGDEYRHYKASVRRWL